MRGGDRGRDVGRGGGRWALVALVAIAAACSGAGGGGADARGTVDGSRDDGGADISALDQRHDVADAAATDGGDIDATQAVDVSANDAPADDGRDAPGEAGETDGHPDGSAGADGAGNDGGDAGIDGAGGDAVIDGAGNDGSDSGTDGAAGVCGNGVVETGEQCDPPAPFTPGRGTSLYCGSACTLVDACEQCKSSCIPNVSCDRFMGAQRDACVAARRCLEGCAVFRQGMWQVDFEICYCGWNNHASCVADGAIGLCRSEIEAAAGGTGGVAFDQVGTGTPMGVALALANCSLTSCGFFAGCAGLTLPICGNGRLDSGEICDPPNGINCSIGCNRVVTVPPRQVISSCAQPAPTAAWSSEQIAGGAYALWATAPDDAWFAQSAVVTHFDGAGWTDALVMRPGEGFRSVWASSASDAWVATTKSLRHWDGVAWSDTLQFGVGLVRGSGPQNVWAASSRRLFRWSGSTWAEMTPFGLGTGTLIRGLAIVSTNDAWVFGTESVNPLVGLALHWNGSVWSRVGPEAGLTLEGRAFLHAWGSSASNIWLSGEANNTSELWHWDGARWTAVGGAAGGSFGALWGTASDDVWATGAGAGSLRHFDGSTWSTVSIGGNGSPTMVAGSRRDDVWATNGTTLYHLHHACESGQPRVFTRFDAPSDLHDLVAGGPNDLWGIGGDTRLHHWNGTSWTMETPFAMFGDETIVRRIAGWPPNDVWAAALHVTRWNGSAWIDMTPPGATSSTEHHVWGRGPNDVWVERRGGIEMFHWNGVSWTQSGFPASVNVAGLSAFGETDAWAVGNNSFGATYFEHWDGSAWTAKTYSTLGRLGPLGLFGVTSSNVWALVINFDVFDTRLIHYDGVSWTVAANQPGYGGYGAVWASSAIDVWATPPQGDLWHNDGQTWSTVPVGADYWTGLTGLPAGDIWAAGRYLDKPVVYHQAPP
jgi:hypothetical protein